MKVEYVIKVKIEGKKIDLDLWAELEGELVDTLYVDDEEYTVDYEVVSG